MSFKRDGNDSNLLKNLQHRRVTEILGDHIPKDEASLLSNGRLTCTICSKRPIFDTMQMLSLHRKGKKHLYELSRYLQHKTELEYKRAKQTQRSFLKTDQITIESNMPSACTITGYAKRKQQERLSNRKFVLDVTDSCTRIKSNFNPPSVIASSASSQVRKYLKSLPRKQSLEKVVNKLRDSYGETTCSQERTSCQVKPDVRKAESSPKKSRQPVNYQLHLLESGWIQDSSGKWIKDPNVEFDSDEDEPPCFS